MPTNKERVVEAVNMLVESPTYSRLVNEMTGILEHWDTHPMTYAGHLSPLNAMLDIGTRDRAAFEKLIQLIEKKRKLMPETKRVDYQRDYMAERRARLARAVALRELQRGTFKNGADRKAYEKELTGRWRAARAEYIKAQGKLSWADRNAAANTFWNGIDATLKTNLAAERAKAAKG